MASNEIEELVSMFLAELNDMSPKDIEEFRKLWLEGVRKQKNLHKFEKLVNAVCDVAINRAKQKLEATQK